MSICLMNPAQLRGCLVHDDELKKEVLEFIEMTVRPLEDNSIYLKACKSGRFELTSEVLSDLAERLDPFIQEGRPGHDFGHNRRDFLAAIALVSSDRNFNDRVFDADINAGLLGAWLHDIATSVWPRYHDKLWECGHGEIGAYLFYQLTADILPEFLRLLTAYSIAAHTHYLKPEEIKSPIKYEQGWQRKPWNDEIFLIVEEDFPGEMPTPLTVRRAVQLSRFGDRSDANGVMLFARHLAAMADSVGEGGQDWAGDQFFEVNHDSLNKAITPVVRKERPKPPTVLEHMIMFSNSNFGNTAYSANDTDVMNEFMHSREKQVNEFARIAASDYDGTGGITDEEMAWGRFTGYMIRVSGSPYIGEPLAVIRLAWDELDWFQKSNWDYAIAYAEKAYGEALLFLQDKILNGDYANRNAALQRFALHALADVW